MYRTAAERTQALELLRTGLSQHRVAALIGCGQTTINRWAFAAGLPRFNKKGAVRGVKRGKRA